MATEFSSCRMALTIVAWSAAARKEKKMELICKYYKRRGCTYNSWMKDRRAQYHQATGRYPQSWRVIAEEKRMRWDGGWVTNLLLRMLDAWYHLQNAGLNKQDAQVYTISSEFLLLIIMFWTTNFIRERDSYSTCTSQYSEYRSFSLDLNEVF